MNPHTIVKQMQEEELARFLESSPHELLKDDYSPEQKIHPYILRMRKKGLGHLINAEAKEAGEENPFKGFRLARR